MLVYYCDLFIIKTWENAIFFSALKVFSIYFIDYYSQSYSTKAVTHLLAKQGRWLGPLQEPGVPGEAAGGEDEGAPSHDAWKQTR